MEHEDFIPLGNGAQIPKSKFSLTCAQVGMMIRANKDLLKASDVLLSIFEETEMTGEQIIETIRMLHKATADEAIKQMAQKEEPADGTGETADS